MLNAQQYWFGYFLEAFNINIMTNPGQYSPEKAADEASLMRGKIENREAKTYGEAEQLVEKEQVLSVDDIKKYTEELKKKIELAKAQVGWNVGKKVRDRESLIAEARANGALFQPAQEALEYFTAMRDLGSLSDPEDVKKLEEIQATVDSLEKQRLEINKNLESLESVPAVLEKVHEKALGEDVERTTDKEYEKAHEQLDPQIDQLWGSILQLASEKNIFWGEKEKQQKEVEADWSRIKDFFGAAMRMLDKPQFATALMEIFYRSGNTVELKEKLSAARKSLGMFSGKEKAAIDFILSKTNEFQWHEHAIDRLAGIDRTLKSKDDEQSALAEQYKNTIFSSWDAQDRINELTGDSKGSRLPASLFFRLRDYRIAIDGTGVDRNNLLNSTAASIFDKITGGERNSKYIYKNPRENTEQK